MDNGGAEKILSFPEQEAEHWIHTYSEDMLQARDAATIEAYTRILEKFATWLALRPGNSGQLRQEAITRTAIEGFLDTLPSFSYKKQARAALSGFCRWLQEDQKLLERNPVRGVSIPAQARLSPRELSTDQRYVIRDLVEREAALWGKAAFALGYFAGCRVSDVSWLLLDATHASRKAGWIMVGHKGGKERTIDLVNEARSPLYDYLHQGERKGSAYVFTSQRAKQRVSADEIDAWRWTEDGVHQWWQQLKGRARLSEATFVSDIDFQESRSRFCAPGASGGLEPGGGRVLPGPYYQIRDASHSNHDPLYAGEPRTREREAQVASRLAPYNLEANCLLKSVVPIHHRRDL